MERLEDYGLDSINTGQLPACVTLILMCAIVEYIQNLQYMEHPCGPDMPTRLERHNDC